MSWNWKEINKERSQFRTHYCLECKQKKPCGNLTSEYCCSCRYHQERQKAREYNSLEKVLATRQKEHQNRYQQLKLLNDYQGCKQCGSQKIDAYELYENNKLVCQPCLVKKAGSSTSPISFARQSKWYQKRWGINLNEWLEKFSQLPVSANCAKKWLKDKQHLNNCVCLEQEAQEIHELFTNSLREMKEKLRKCTCKSSKKIRIDSDYYAYCEKCEKSIVAASKKRVIKNRNDPKFWGLNIPQKVLCGNCLENKKTDMKSLRRAKFNEYKKLGRL